MMNVDTAHPPTASKPASRTDSQSSASAGRLETPNCPVCETSSNQYYMTAQDDLTGKAGDFRFVECDECGHHYQSPRIKLEYIGEYYDGDYVSHRKKNQWGLFGRLTEWGFGKHDRDKVALVTEYKSVDAGSQVLDIGCARATFLFEMKKQTGAHVTGIDFKDLPDDEIRQQVGFHKGLLRDANLQPKSLDAITMWHYLEHCYEPLESLRRCREALKDDGVLVVEVPCLDSMTAKVFGARWPGLQAPQHTSLYSKNSLRESLEKSGFEIVAHLNYGAFPRFFYYYTGLIFLFTKGRGINLQSHVLPYLLGSALFYPFIKLSERFVSHSMQTVICHKTKG